MSGSSRSAGALTRSVLSAISWTWVWAPGWSALVATLSALRVALPLGVLLILRRLFDALGAGPPSIASAAAAPLVLGAAGLALLALLARIAESLAVEHQAERVSAAASDALHRQTSRLALEQLEDPAVLDLLHRALREGANRPQRLVERMQQIVAAGLSLAGLVALTWTVDPRLALPLLFAAAPALLLRLRAGDRLAAWDRERTRDERRAWYYQWLLTSEPNAAEVRLHELGSALAGRYRELRSRLSRERLAMSARRLVANGLGDALVLVASFAAILWLLSRVGKGVSLGELVLFLGVLQRGASSVGELLAGLGGAYEDRRFLESFDELMRLEPAIDGPVRVESIPSAPHVVRFAGVSYRYPGRTETALAEIDLEVRAGEILALVGENGAGKSTLLRLLTRLADPTAGRILLNGVDYQRLDPLALRRLFSCSPQQFARYQLTLRDNVAFGAPGGEADRVALEGASDVVQLDSLRARLAGGWEGRLGTWFERGVEPSAGEWQRVALARALAHSASFLVLDEPTSPLDPRTEDEVFEAIRRDLGGRGLILVTHRLGLARRADRIVGFEDGRMVEMGTHEELSARDGPYSRLFRLQATAFRD